jgi:hypothetical protein
MGKHGDSLEKQVGKLDGTAITPGTSLKTRGAATHKEAPQLALDLQDPL